MKIKTYLDKIALGDPQTYKNMGVIPIIDGKKSNLEYLLLQDCIPKETVEVIETGDVNKLTLINKTDKNVLIIKGDYVTGGRQNRMITVNGLIRPGKIDVPCHCVQRGRWSYGGGMRAPSRRSPETAPMKTHEHFLMGSMMSARARGGVMKCYSGSRGQSETWGNVQGLFEAADMHSDTEDYDEFYQGKEEDLKEFVSKFNLVDGQIGNIVKIGKEHYFIDLFDKAETLEKQYEKLLTSYAIDAVIEKYDGELRFTSQEAEKFLADIANEEEKRSKSLDLGEDIELAGVVIGAGLEHEKTLVYLGAKTKGDEGKGKGGGLLRDLLEYTDPNSGYDLRPPRESGSPSIFGPGRSEQSRRRGPEYGIRNLWLGRHNL